VFPSFTQFRDKSDESQADWDGYRERLSVVAVKENEHREAYRIEEWRRSWIESEDSEQDKCDWAFEIEVGFSDLGIQGGEFDIGRPHFPVGLR
jgi:hypothetical protein